MPANARPAGRLLPAANLLLAALVACVVFGASAGCSTARYLTRQGLGEWHILRGRRPIPEVLADPTVPAETRRRLALAARARRFGVEFLGLAGGDGFTRYYDAHGPLAWSVIAAPKDSLQPVLHHFPVAGAIPYLGFFRKKDALAERDRLAKQGLDTCVVEVAGFSTRGLTSDPIYSSMLEGGDASIVEVVLHEMLHGTLYLPGHSDWNESLATFVGLQGAALFFRMRGDSASAERVFAEARRREERAAAFARFLGPVVHELSSLYAERIPLAEKLRRREVVFARTRRDYLRLFPPAPGHPPGSFATGPLNNACLAIHTVYHRGTPDHERLYHREGDDLRAFLRLYERVVATSSDPIARLHALAR